MLCLKISQTAASKCLMNGYVCVSTTWYIFFKETRRQETQTHTLKSRAKWRLCTVFAFFFFIKKFSAKDLPKFYCKWASQFINNWEMLWTDAQCFYVCFQEITTHWAETMYTNVPTFRPWLQSHDNLFYRDLQSLYAHKCWANSELDTWSIVTIHSFFTEKEMLVSQRPGNMNVSVLF